jgi:hypothetical protein
LGTAINSNRLAFSPSIDRQRPQDPTRMVSDSAGSATAAQRHGEALVRKAFMDDIILPRYTR